MVPPTRRRLLRTAAAVATAALAGCSGLVGEQSGTSRSVSENADSTIPGGTTERDPETRLLRADTDEPPVRIGAGDETPARPGRRSSRLSSTVIDTRSRADQLAVSDGVDADAVAAFRSATAFDSETLYLETRRVEECFRLRLCGISWTPGKIRTAYAREPLANAARLVTHGDDELARYRRRVRPTRLDDPIRRYVTATLRARSVPKACERVLAALNA